MSYRPGLASFGIPPLADEKASGAREGFRGVLHACRVGGVLSDPFASSRRPLPVLHRDGLSFGNPLSRFGDLDPAVREGHAR